MSRDFLRKKTDPKGRNVPVCLNMWVLPREGIKEHTDGPEKMGMDVEMGFQIFVNIKVVLKAKWSCSVWD